MTALRAAGIAVLLVLVLRPVTMSAALFWASLLIAFLLGLRGYTWPWLAYLGYVAVNVAMALFLSDTPYGLFGNPNYLGVAVALGLAIAIGYGYWWFAPFALGGLWWCSSRTALVGAGVAVLIGTSRRYPALAICSALAIAAFALSVSGGRDVAFWARFGVWQDTINHLTVFGSGLGSFVHEYASWPVRTNMTGFLAAHAYNDFLELVFELGIMAIPLWVFIALALEADEPGARLVVWTYLALSLTFFPLFVHPVGQALAFALGSLYAKGERNACSLLPNRRALHPHHPSA